MQQHNKFEILKAEDKTILSLKDVGLNNIIYMDGYFRSFLLISENLENKENRETLIYPCLFCFYQYMELWLKTLIIVVNEKNYNELKIANHSIEKIFEKYKNNFIDIDEITSNDFDIIESTLKYINSFAINSTEPSIAFRFPIKKDNKTLQINFEKIEELKENNYKYLKNTLTECLNVANKFTKGVFIKYFENIFSTI